MPRSKDLLMKENVILKQQLQLINRKRSWALNLTTVERFIFGFISLLFDPSHLASVAYVISYKTLLKFHKALVRKKYSLLFLSKTKKRTGRKGPSQELTNYIVGIKQRNPQYGCQNCTSGLYPTG